MKTPWASNTETGRCESHIQSLEPADWRRELDGLALAGGASHAQVTTSTPFPAFHRVQVPREAHLGTLLTGSRSAACTEASTQSCYRHKPAPPAPGCGHLNLNSTRFQNGGSQEQYGRHPNTWLSPAPAGHTAGGRTGGRGGLRPRHFHRSHCGWAGDPRRPLPHIFHTQEVLVAGFLAPLFRADVLGQSSLPWRPVTKQAKCP